MLLDVLVVLVSRFMLSVSAIFKETYRTSNGLK